MAIGHVAECEGPIQATMWADTGHMELVVTAAAGPGVPIRVTKLAAYHSSRSEAPAELLERCGRTLERGRRAGFAALRASQREHLDRFWDRADVKVDTGVTGYSGLLFDLDGVITRTATIHAAAWKRLFDDFLGPRGGAPFDIATDYPRYVDGRPRYDAVASVLESRGLLALFDAMVTGRDLARLGLRGKPAPDTFVRAAELLGVAPDDAVVFEDALSGVRAGRAGGFALVVGVDRGGATGALLRSGADIACSDLRRLWPGA